jgi:hypothetical protein
VIRPSIRPVAVVVRGAGGGHWMIILRASMAGWPA